MKTMKKRKIILVSFCLLITASLIFPTIAFARGENLTDTINEGEVYDHSVVLHGPTVTMEGVVNGDLFAIGTDVKINGEVNGDLAVIGKNVTLNGQVSGNLYISALFLVVGPQASLGQDVYFIGNNINTQAGSTISRDLDVVGMESKFSGEVNRRVNALVGPLNIVNKLYEFLLSKGWFPKSQQIRPGSFQDGLEQRPDQVIAFGLTVLRNFTGIPSSTIVGSSLDSVSVSQVSKQSNAIDVQRLETWGVSLLRNLVALLLLGLLIIWLAPGQLSLASEQTRTRPWRALLTGLLVFFLGWVVALLLVVLILALAFFFYWISLPNLGFFTGAIGLLTLGLAMSIFWLSIAYFSKIVIAFLVGMLIFKRFFPKYAQNRIWPYLTGVVIYALLASIPYLGWLIAVVATLFGLGAIWMLSNTRKQSDTPPEAQLQEGGEGQDSPVVTEG
jgi:hypothetical protein